MEAISFTLDDFDLVVHPFNFACMDGVITVVDNTVTMALKPVGKTG